MPRLLFLIAAVLFTGEIAAAQEGRTEVFAGAGWGRTWDDEGTIGTGLNVNAGVGFNVIPRVALELEVMTAKNKREPGAGSGFHAEGRTTTVGPNVLFHFATGRIKPFVLAGIHFFHHDGFAGFAPDRPEAKESHWAFRVGAGMKAFVSDRWFIRPEFACSSGGNGRTAGALEFPIWSPRFSAGIGYQW